MAVTETEILDVTRQLLDTGGPGSVSVKRIAAALDVPRAAIYRFFPDRDAVFTALIERILGEVDHAAVDAGGQTWRRRLEVLAAELRKALSGHPAVVSLMLVMPLRGPQAAAVGHRIFDLLADAGITDVDAQRAAMLLKAYLLGALALGAGADQYVWGLRRVLRGLTRADLP
jgi:TetR/AcrR family tetracycline transcriptional repressor